MTCEYQSPRDEIGFYCSLNRYGGRPHAIACQQCMASGENNAANAQPPSMGQMVKTASAAAANFARSGFISTDADTLATREATCRACDLWDSAALNGTGRCKKCGCSTWAKLRMATEKCPLGKW